MIFSERQLESFSTPPFKYEQQQVIDTHTEIRKAIDTYFDKKKIMEAYDLSTLPVLDPFLQGSYSNDTNISKSSDVDFVVRIENVWRADTSSLSPPEKENYSKNSKDCSYSFSQFNNDVWFCLQEHFGTSIITNDNKCLRLRKHSKFCDADIIPAFTYKLYGTFQSLETQRYIEGITFDTNEGKQVINFPKIHQTKLVEKSKATNGNFKETVRMFKTLRDELVANNVIHNDIAKSYYIENLLYNVDSSLFTGPYKDRFIIILGSLIDDYNNSNMSNNYMCANNVYKLFAVNTWKIDSVKSFLLGLSHIRDNSTF